MTTWINCKVFNFQFGNERVVELGDRDFVVPADKVMVQAGNDGRVIVELFNRADGMWAEIPATNITSIPVEVVPLMGS